jgi:hypothetical protein
MSVVVSGPNGSGSVTAYTAPQGRDVVIETLTFTIVADGTAGIHRARVQFVPTTGATTATMDDLNTSGPSQTTTYTYGLGLNASACTTATGWAVTDALPWTDLRGSGKIVVTAINDSGVAISGDAISNVFLQVRDDGASDQDNTPMPLLVPQAA